MFTISATIIFALLFLIWKSDDPPNLLIRIVLMGMAAWGAFESLHWSGYIIKI